jgi:hypothetical protein
MDQLKEIQDLGIVITQSSDAKAIFLACEKLQQSIMYFFLSVSQSSNQSTFSIQRSPKFKNDRLFSLMESIQYQSHSLSLRVSELSFRLYPVEKAGLCVAAWDFFRVLNCCCHVLLHLEAIFDVKLRFPLMQDDSYELLDFPDYRSPCIIFDDWHFQYKTLRYSNPLASIFNHLLVFP